MSDNQKYDRAIEATENLKALMQRKAVLLEQLRLALLLQKFEPRAFENDGACRISGSSNGSRPWSGSITLHLPFGEDKTYPALKVPFDLWPKTMQEEYIAKHNKKPQEGPLN